MGRANIGIAVENEASLARSLICHGRDQDWARQLARPVTPVTTRGRARHQEPSRAGPGLGAPSLTSRHARDDTERARAQEPSRAGRQLSTPRLTTRPASDGH